MALQKNQVHLQTQKQKEMYRKLWLEKAESDYRYVEWMCFFKRQKARYTSIRGSYKTFIYYFIYYLIWRKSQGIVTSLYLTDVIGRRSGWMGGY